MSPRRDDSAALGLRIVTELFKRATPRQLVVGAALVLLVLAVIGFLNWRGGSGGPVTAPDRGGSAEPSGPGAWEVHFTSPEIPTNKAHYKGGLDERLVALMNRAQKTLDVCVYDFDLVNVAEAMAAAKARGVAVRLVTDGDTVRKAKDGSGKKAVAAEAFEKLWSAEIPIIDDGGRHAIMHNKFTVVDGEWVQTGSWNYTVGDTYRLNNNMVIVRSRELAENYTAEFEKMFAGKHFGAKKARGVPNPELTVGGVPVRIYFAPKDHVAKHVVEALGRAEKSIYFLAFQFTHDGIGRVVREKAEAGLAVGGVFEKRDQETEHSEYGKLKAAGIDVYLDGNPYTMHHKVFVVDGRTVIFGSFNFSEAADKDNDENLLIVEDAGLARQFKEEYDRVLDWAKNPPKRK